MNKYFTASFVILGLFLLTTIIVSPKGAFNNAPNNTPIGKADFSIFLNINNSHYPALNEIMILLTDFGREVFWPITIILLFVLGGRTGKKTAVVIAISMLVLIPLGELAKDIVARPGPVIPASDFLISADKDYAFPSGHAVIVSAGATGALMLFRGTPRRFVVSTILAIEGSSCLSIKNICWWPLSFGCNRGYFIGSRGISYFCRCGKTYRILVYATQEVVKTLGSVRSLCYVISFIYPQLGLNLI